LIAVSAEVRDDLVRLRVAAPEKFTVIPLGLDLTPFLDDGDRARRRDAVRAQWRIGSDDEVITLVSRLVPVKRIDRFLRVAQLLSDRPRTRFVVVGDGELRQELSTSEPARALGDRLLWAGFRRDMPDVCVASDVVVLTSDNEGTPVSLIEAQAASVPVVGTDVGGMRSAVRDGETGLLAPPDDEPRLASLIGSLIDDRARAARMGASGRSHARASFDVARLVEDHDRLYRLLAAIPSITTKSFSR
jgi:glycosyltransferase involved in cell wall biosynthesis